MNKDKELVESIERLGDMLENVETLAKDIFTMVTRRESPYHDNIALSRIVIMLNECCMYYSYFHGYYLGRLARTQEKPVHSLY